MRLVELPVFVSPREHTTKKMFINADQVFFVTEVEVPTALVGPNQKGITRPGTLVSPSGGAGLMVDLLVYDVLRLLQKATHLLDIPAEIPTTQEQGQKEVKEDGNKPTTGNKKRVRQGSKV